MREWFLFHYNRNVTDRQVTERKPIDRQAINGRVCARTNRRQLSSSDSHAYSTRAEKRKTICSSMFFFSFLHFVPFVGCARWSFGFRYSRLLLLSRTHTHIQSKAAAAAEDTLWKLCFYLFYEYKTMIEWRQHLR